MKCLNRYIKESDNIQSLYQYIAEADDDMDMDLDDAGGDDSDEGEGDDNKESDKDSEKDDDKKDSKDDKEKEKLLKRGNIKFTIWKEPKTKVSWLKDNDYNYQKIEYQYRSEDKKVEIDFLLGYVPEEKTWKLWIGKIGRISYDDDPWCDLETKKFAEAIVAALDKVENFMKDVEEDNPDNWIQYYKEV